MSTRYIKKLFGDNVILEDNLEEPEQEIYNLHLDEGRPKLFNVFDLLNENPDNEIEEEMENEESEVIDQNEEQICVIKSKSKKKRKKPKKLQVQKNSSDRSKLSEEQEINNQENIDEIEKTIQQINKLLGEPTPSTSLNSRDNSQMFSIVKSKEQILRVQHKHLNVYNELKRIFGSKTIQAEKSKPRTRGRTGHLKKTWLVSLRESMLPTSKTGFSMTIDKTMSGNNVQYFLYEHSPSYRQVQQKFITAVESLNPDNIISIVNTYPYHVDTLLQSAEFCKLGEELAMAATLIERALFYLEYAFHPSFKLTTANCRLDYRKQQNRALFITLFKHLVLVGGRACYRTSLELCKFLLSLDPEGDPLAVVLMIDFYAIRSKEYEWFCEFCNLWENARNLQQLPNIAYSLALAHFHLGEQEKADQLLQNALIMFPGVLVPLLDKCSISADSKVLSNEFFFVNPQYDTPTALEKIQSLYIARSFHIWKEAEILPWLEKQVHIVLQRIEAHDDYVKFCDMKRKKRYLGKLPRNILRHLIISDLPNVTVDVQEIKDEGPILSHDPLPPTDSIDIYTYTRTRVTGRANQTNSNFLSLFFSSIFMNIESDGLVANGANHQHENPGDFD